MHKPTILDGIDSEVGQRLVPRRDAVRTALAAGFAMSSVPMLLGMLSRSAFAQGGLPQSIIDVLNFALTLEYLEAEFYTRGVGAAGLIPPSDFAIFDQIRKHEVAHVNLLKSVLGSAAVPKPTFDYTAHGMFPNPFADYPTFQALSQAFEDTGVRAYKGQAPNLMANKIILDTALRIHAVEARHAAEVRRLRGNFSEVAPHEGWPTFNQTDIPGTQPVYAGEENTVQAGINVVAVTTVGAEAVSEAFDEPLSKQQVLAIVAPFIVRQRS